MTGKRKIVQAMLATALIVGAALGIARHRRSVGEDDFKAWNNWLLTATEDDALPRLQSLVEAGDASIERLVSGLVSPQPAIASASAMVLREQLILWEALTEEERATRAVPLVRLLAQQAGSMERSALASTADLVRHLLRGPMPSNGDERHQFLADCETVLQMAERGERSLLASDFRPTEGELAHLVHPPTGAVANELEGRPGIEALIHPPVADEFQPSISSPGSLSTDVLEATPLLTPQTLPPEQPVRPLFPEGPLQPLLRPIESPPHDPVELLNHEIEFDSLRNIDLMQLLHSLNPTLADQADEELASRGFDPRSRQVANRMTDPREEVRLALVNELAAMGLVDTRSWLLWLSHDVSPLVRAAAVSVMATSQDPELKMRIREMELEETDAQVSDQIRHAIESMRR